MSLELVATWTIQVKVHNGQGSGSRSLVLSSCSHPDWNEDIFKDTSPPPPTTEATGPKKLDPPRLSCWEEKAASSERDASGHLAGETAVETMMGQGWERAACLYALLSLYLNLNLISGPLDGLGEL